MTLYGGAQWRVGLSTVLGNHTFLDKNPVIVLKMNKLNSFISVSYSLGQPHQFKQNTKENT